MLRHIFAASALLFACAAGAKTSAPATPAAPPPVVPSGALVPGQVDRIGVFFNPDGTCVSRWGQDFGAVVACPK